jgi:hypothetical protein
MDVYTNDSGNLLLWLAFLLLGAVVIFILMKLVKPRGKN